MRDGGGGENHILQCVEARQGNSSPTEGKGEILELAVNIAFTLAAFVSLIIEDLFVVCY